jgi:hypothetical protein
MTHRGLRWFILLLMLVAIGLGLHTCADRRGETPQPSDPRPPAPTSAASAPAHGADDIGEMLRARHNAAMRSAVSTLHAYIAVLPEDDRAKADAFWIDARPADDAHEADLRALAAPPRALRVQNGAPRSLDDAPVPTNVEIPVQLRLHLEQPPARRYEGWYRLRRIGDGDDWRITGAAIDALPAPG